MELITHLLTGILVQLACFIFFIFPLNIILTIIFGFLSHFLIDTLAKITYHTPEPHKEDKFWVAWHIITPVLAIILAIWVILIGKFWFFLLGTIAANAVDIWDWLILRPIQNPEAKFWGEKLYIHPTIDWIRDHLFGWLPNWNYKKKGIIPEIITIVSLWVSIFLMIPLLS